MLKQGTPAKGTQGGEGCLKDSKHLLLGICSNPSFGQCAPCDAHLGVGQVHRSVD